MPKNSERDSRSGENRRFRRKSGDTADWASADAVAIQRAICSAALCGGALRFGYSRDGGAYAIGVYGDGEPYTEFVRPSEDIDQILADLTETFESIHDDQMRPRKGSQNA